MGLRARTLYNSKVITYLGNQWNCIKLKDRNPLEGTDITGLFALILINTLIDKVS